MRARFGSRAFAKLGRNSLSEPLKGVPPAVLDRLRKVLEVEQDASSTAGERAAATVLARRILTRWQLSRDDVGTQGRSTTVVTTIDLEPHWAETLVLGVLRVLGGDVTLRRTPQNTAIFVGDTSQIDRCHRQLVALIERVHALARSTDYHGAQLDAFRLGVSQCVVRRLQERHAQHPAGMVLDSKATVADLLRAAAERPGSTNEPRPIVEWNIEELQAWTAGARNGKRVSLLTHEIS